MTENMVMGIAKEALYTGMIVAGPILILSLVVGLLISIFQATTQIQEQTLTFVPKLVVILLALVLGGSWMLHEMMKFTTKIINLISVITK